METSFCSRCGYLLTGTAELFKTGGSIPQIAQGSETGTSPRRRGLKQGLFIFLLTFLVVPIVAIFTIAINVEPFGVAISAIALFVGGLLRMAYALMFESNEPPGLTAANQASFNPVFDSQRGLPPQRSYDAASYLSPTGQWRDTNELEPKSVTENTTKLLEKEEKHQ